MASASSGADQRRHRPTSARHRRSTGPACGRCRPPAGFPGVANGDAPLPANGPGPATAFIRSSCARTLVSRAEGYHGVGTMRSESTAMATAAWPPAPMAATFAAAAKAGAAIRTSSATVLASRPHPVRRDRHVACGSRAVDPRQPDRSRRRADQARVGQAAADIDTRRRGRHTALGSTDRSTGPRRCSIVAADHATHWPGATIMKTSRP